MTFGEFAGKVRGIYECNAREYGPMEVKVAVDILEIPFADLVFKNGKCVLCDATAARRAKHEHDNM